MPLNSVDLPAPFGPTTAISAPAVDRAVEMMHRRMAVIAEREVAESQLRRRSTCSGHQRIAQNTAAQISAISTAADRQPLERRQPQDRRRDRGRRMAHGPGDDGDDGAWSWVGVGLCDCYSITFRACQGSRRPAHLSAEPHLPSRICRGFVAKPRDRRSCVARSPRQTGRSHERADQSPRCRHRRGHDRDGARRRRPLRASPAAATPSTPRSIWRAPASPIALRHRARRRPLFRRASSRSPRPKASPPT